MSLKILSLASLWACIKAESTSWKFFYFRSKLFKDRLAKYSPIDGIALDFHSVSLFPYNCIFLRKNLPPNTLQVMRNLRKYLRLPCSAEMNELIMKTRTKTETNFILLPSQIGLEVPNRQFLLRHQ